MDAREAIKAAKAYVEYALDGEEITEIRVEELEFDEHAGLWLVTLGIMRPSVEARADIAAAILGNKAYQRSYKLITINDGDASIKSMKIRQIETA